MKRFRKNYWAAYTVLFGILALLLFLCFRMQGDGMIWSKDGICQHYDALVYIGKWCRRILTEHKIPMWDYTIGHGADVISTLHYYVIGDPLNLLSIMVPERYTEYLYEFLIFLRLYLAGIAFSVFCISLNKGKKATLVGALGYTFSGYALVVLCMHPFFLNSMIYLPLLLLGAERIIKKQRPTLFVLMVFVSAISNFYFFYMLALAVVFYVIASCLSKGYVKKIGVCIRLCMRFLFYAIVGVMMSAVVLLPTILLFLNTYRSAAEQITMLSYGKEYYRQLPFMFTIPMSAGNYSIWGFTVLALLAVILLFVRKGHRTLKCSFIIGTVMFLVPAAGKIMNGFSYASNRWSFMYAMLINYILVVVWQEYVNTRSVYVQYVLLAFMMLNLGWNIYLECYEIKGSSVTSGKAYETLEDTAAFAVRDIQDKEDTFGRYEADDVRPRNASLVAGTYGIETYWSLIPACKSQYFMDMEVLHNYSYMFTNNNQRTFLDALSNVCYYVQKKDTSPVPYGYEKLEEHGEYTIYKNSNPLPLGYTSDSYLSMETYEQLSGLEKQEALLQGVLIQDADKIEEKLQKTEPESTAKEVDYQIESTDGVELDLEKGTFRVTKKKATMTLRIEGLDACETYVSLQGLKAKHTVDSYWDVDSQILKMDFESLGYSTGLRLYTPYYLRPSGQTEFLVNLGYHQEAIKTLTVTFDKTAEGLIDSLCVYCQPMENYDSYLARYQEEILEDVVQDTNRITGNITVSSDKLLRLSVPYDKGWTAYVDGKKTPIYQADTMYMALLLTPGEHQIELRYETYGLRWGIWMSLLGLAIFCVILMGEKKNEQKNGRS